MIQSDYEDQYILDYFAACLRIDVSDFSNIFDYASDNLKDGLDKYFNISIKNMTDLNKVQMYKYIEKLTYSQLCELIFLICNN